MVLLSGGTSIASGTSQYSLWNIQYSLWNIQYSLWNIQYSLRNIQYSLWNIQYSLRNFPPGTIDLKMEFLRNHQSDYAQILNLRSQDQIKENFLWKMTSIQPCVVLFIAT